jgi:hypothetical protein
MSSGTVGFTITMDAASVEKVLTATAERFPRYVNSWLVQAGTITKEEMASKVNEGIGAAYGQGVKNNIDATYDEVAQTVMVKPNSNVPYADALETGSRPHWPDMNPDGARAQWCELKGLSLWAIGATIAKVGTKPHPFIEPTYNVVKGPIARLFQDGVAAFVDHMGILV